jgi:hypothetical protein
MAALIVQPNRFADYFVICGLDAASGLESDKLAGKFLRRVFVLDCKQNN